MNEMVSFYKRNGYHLFRDFWDKRELAQVHQDAKSIFLKQIRRVVENVDESVDGEKFDQLMFQLFTLDMDAFVNCGKQAQHLISLHRLSLSAKLISLLKEFEIEFPVISVRPSMFFNSRNLDKTGHYWKLDSHQDWRSSQGSLDSVTVWFPYVDCNMSLGALQVIPKSHMQGLLKSDKVDYYSKISESVNEDEYVSVEMNAGDLLVFSSFLVHRSGINSTQRIRWSSQFRFNNLAERTFIERKFPNPFTYKPLENLITPDFPHNDELSKIFR